MSRRRYLKKDGEIYWCPSSYYISKIRGKITCGCMAYKTFRGDPTQKCCKHIAGYLDPRSFNSDLSLNSESLNSRKKVTDDD